MLRVMRKAAFVAALLSLSLALPAAAAEVRRDPKGQTGISPYYEALAQAKAALKGGDANQAVNGFKQAVQSNPDEMYGYLLLAQAELRANDAKAAFDTVKLGRSKKGTERVQAKMLLLYANLVEQQANVPPPGVDDKVKQSTPDLWERVKETWSAYAVFLTAHASLPDYQATSSERKKQVVARNARDQKFIAVRKRMLEETKKKP